jgi:16S rRNA (guanine527-N7)-methyltransferase
MHDAARFAREIQRQLPQLNGAPAGALGRWLELVELYNPSLSLTGFAGPEQLVGELVGESLRLLELGGIDPGWHCVDLGSGCGAPLMPLALLCPQPRFTAAEASPKRAAFLHQVIMKLKLTNIAVASGRAEELARARPTACGLVTSRAFAPPDKLLKLAARLCAPGGQVRGYLGADSAPLEAAALKYGFNVERLSAYSLGESMRQVYLLSKTATKAS